MHRIVSILVILTLIFTFTPVAGLRQPVGIAGYVTLSGQPVQGASVIVTNLDTGENDTATTNSNGLYVCSLYGQDGDILEATVQYNNQTGTAQTVVNLNYTTQWLNITIGGNLVARFSYYPPNPRPNEAVKFIDRSTGNINTWLWNFGDGTTGTGKNPTHTYENEGTYTVTLEIRDASNNFDRTQKIITVRKISTTPYIPEPQKPTYPEGYSIKEMCDLLRISNLSKSSDKVRIVFLDSGVASRTYQVNNTVLNLGRIEKYGISGDTEDKYGHGTAVASILLYILTTKIDNYELISIKVFDPHGQSTEKSFIDAMDLAKRLHPDIVSISAGAIPNENDLISKKAEELTHAGIVVVASAGNSGSDLNTILSPAVSKDVIAVGAEDPRQTILNLKDDTICEWSSRGSPVLKKPNCVAPGESIRLPWGKTQERVMSGTSFSAPFVAGGIAVSISKNRGLYDLVKILYFWDGAIVTNAVKSSVEETCYHKGVYYIWGAGIPQFDKLPDTLYGKLMTLLIVFIVLIVAISSAVAIVVWKIFGKRTKFPKW